MSSPVDHVAVRTVGVVESVAPGEITVLLDLDAPQAVTLHAAQPQRFPRLNGFLLIPNEIGSLVGVITWLGVERSPYPKRPGLKDFGLVDLPFPLRKLRLVPLGTLAGADDAERRHELKRGVLAFPSVGDPVLLPTTRELQALVEAEGDDRRVTIGTSPVSGEISVSVDPDKLFGRHLAVLGNTGSGKSCSVAGLIRWSLEAADKSRGSSANARFIVLDPNGEYRRSFGGLGDVRLFEVSPSGDAQAVPLRVPAWMWNSHEWAGFAQAAPGTQRPLLMQALRNLRAGQALQTGPEIGIARVVRGYLTRIEEKLAQGPTGYGGPFGVTMGCGELLEHIAADLRRYIGKVPALDASVQQLADEAEATATNRRYSFGGGQRHGYNDFTEGELDAVRERLEALRGLLPSVEAIGGAGEDAPIPFKPGDMAEHLELLATTDDFSHAQSFVATLTLRVRSMLADTRLTPVVAPDEDVRFAEWLEAYIGAPEAANGRIAVLDLSMVPSDVLHLVIAVVARVTFEALQRYRRRYEKALPTVLVLEEAHTFVQRHLGDDSSHATSARLCRETFERIAREGRKFGLGLVLSSQRPSELSDTVLSQCNTFLLHRLVNDRDQQLVGRLVPDNVGDLLGELPSLPSQQAILLGWAASVPTLVRLHDLPREQRPRSDDPAFWDVWTGTESRPLDWQAIADDWTGQNPAALPPDPG